MTAAPPRRWFQFSLRTLILLVTAACLPLAWLAYARKGVKQREAAIATIENLGGRVEIDAEARSYPGWLRPLLDDHALGEPTFVSFTGTTITDSDLAPVVHLRQLKMVYLTGTPVSDGGLGHFARLKKVEQLYLNRTRVTDQGLANLSGFAELQILDLADTDITDAGLVHLSGLVRLEKLYLDGTKTSPQGVDQLKLSLPHAAISR